MPRSRLLAARCGGGGSPGVASVTSPTTSTKAAAQTGAVAYSRCMRSHGVLSFPDPNSSGELQGTQPKSRRVGKSLMRAADRVCNHLLPSGLGGLVTAPQDTAQQLRIKVADEPSFAGCMRSRGVTRFPDPTAQGDLSVEIVQAHGINVHSPAVPGVVQASVPASHGGLTTAKVREALPNAGG